MSQLSMSVLQQTSDAALLSASCVHDIVLLPASCKRTLPAQVRPVLCGCDCTMLVQSLMHKKKNIWSHG